MYRAHNIHSCYPFKQSWNITDCNAYLQIGIQPYQISGLEGSRVAIIHIQIELATRTGKMWTFHYSTDSRICMWMTEEKQLYASTRNILWCLHQQDFPPKCHLKAWVALRISLALNFGCVPMKIVGYLSIPLNIIISPGINTSDDNEVNWL